MPFYFERDDFEFILSRAGKDGYTVVARWRDYEVQGYLPLLSQRLSARKIFPIVTSQQIYDDLRAAGVDFAPWLKAIPESQVGRYDELSDRYVPVYHLPRIRLTLEADELIPLPWEALVQQWPDKNKRRRRSIFR